MPVPLSSSNSLWLASRWELRTCTAYQRMDRGPTTVQNVSRILPQSSSRRIQRRTVRRSRRGQVTRSW